MPAKLNLSFEKQCEIAEYATNHTLQETAETFGISKNSVVRYKHKIGLVKPKPRHLLLHQRLENHTISKDNCWLTDLPSNGHGYLNITVNGKTKYAHRIAYELHKGKIPDNMCVCHSCDNPACINPSHLFIGTQRENVADCISKGRSNTPKGENHHKAKLTESDVHQIKHLLVETNLTLKKIANIFGVTEVLEEPPMLLTWRGMYFLFNRKTNQGSIAKNEVITYTYIEIYGCALRAITVETVGVSDD